MKKLFIAIMVTFTIATAGCVYKPPIQQGNILEQSEVDKIKPGMTKEQIAFILGNPVLDTNLQSNTWYYLYYLTPSKGKKREDRLVLTFDGDVLQSLEGTVKPGDSETNEEVLEKIEDSK